MGWGTGGAGAWGRGGAGGWGRGARGLGARRIPSCTTSDAPTEGTCIGQNAKIRSCGCAVGSPRGRVTPNGIWKTSVVRARYIRTPPTPPTSPLACLPTCLPAFLQRDLSS